MCSLAKMAPKKLLSLDSLNLRVELGLKHFAADYLRFVQLPMMANQIFVRFCINLLEQFLLKELYGHVPEACRGAEKRTV